MSHLSGGKLSTVQAPACCDGKGVIRSFWRRHYCRVDFLTFDSKSSFERRDGSWSVFADLCIGATDGETDKKEEEG